MHKERLVVRVGTLLTLVLHLVHCTLVSHALITSGHVPWPQWGQRARLSAVRIIQSVSCESAGTPVQPMWRMGYWSALVPRS